MQEDYDPDSAGDSGINDIKHSAPNKDREFLKDLLEEIKDDDVPEREIKAMITRYLTQHP